MTFEYSNARTSSGTIFKVKEYILQDTCVYVAIKLSND